MQSSPFEPVPSSSPDSLEYWVDVCYDSVYRLHVRLCGNPSLAEDLTQTTFTGLAVSWKPLGDHEQSKRYIMRSAVNAWRKHCRKRLPTVLPHGQLDQILGGGREPDALVSQREEMGRAYRALLSLPPNQRAAIVFVVLERMSYQEAGAILGASVDTVSKWRTRGLNRLRQVLGTGRMASIGKEGSPNA